MNLQRRLGRGLEALLGQPMGNMQNDDASLQSPDAAVAQLESAAGPAPGLTQLSVYDVDSNPYQPRQNLDEAEIDALAASIHNHGLLQPIVVRQVGERYQLIAGERRLRSHQSWLDPCAGACARSRRSPNGRTGHHRKLAA